LFYFLQIFLFLFSLRNLHEFICILPLHCSGNQSLIKYHVFTDNDIVAYIRLPKSQPLIASPFSNIFFIDLRLNTYLIKMKNYYRISVLAFITAFCFAFNTTNAQVIRTVAGTGYKGNYGDGGPADTAQLNTPQAVVVDKSGNFYIADYQNNLIREVTKNGIISTVVGILNSGGAYNGDGIPASSAQLNGPQGLALDASGNLYIADAANNRVRIVNFSSGNINTFAGTGSAGYSGDTYGASTAQLNNPTSVAVDKAGNVYIADYNNYVVRKVNTLGNISTVAGNDTAGYTGDGGQATLAHIVPNGICVDTAGNLYIADGSYNVIRKVTVSTGIITTIAGNGTAGYNGDNMPATASELYAPQGIAADSVGNIYIADFNNSRIRKVNFKNDTITTLAGIGYGTYSGDGMEANTAGLSNPTGVALDDSGNVFIADNGNNRIRRIAVRGPSITSQPTFSKSTICNGSSATIGITVNGTGTTYQWFVDSAYGPWVKLTNAGVYSGVTTDSLRISKALTTQQQPSYRCVIDNGYDTSSSNSLYITNLPSVVFTGPTDSICVGAPTQIIAGIFNGGGYSPARKNNRQINYFGATYSWSNGDSTDTIVVKPMVTTTYSVAVSQYGCVKDTSITIEVDRTKLAIQAFPSSTVCSGTEVGLFAEHGTASYTWTGGVNNGVAFAPSATKTYTVTGNDGLGCTLIDSIKITVNPLPTLSVSTTPKDTICAGSSVTLTGSGATTFNWSNNITNGVAFSPVSSAVYYLTGTNVNGCSASISVPVVVNVLPIVTGTASPDAVCKGATTTLTGNGASTYSWSGGVNNNIAFTPTSSGSYTVIGTDTHGCVNSDVVNITVNPLPVISISAFPSPTLCQGSSVALFGGGGNSYAWTGGVNNGVSFTPSASGTYTVTGIDGNGCKSKDSIAITVHHTVVPTVTSTNTTCGLKNGYASVTGSNGVPPYKYSWSTNPASSNSFIDSLAAGTYVVTISDSANCASTAAVSIASSSSPILSVSTTNSNCGAQGTGSAIVAVTGGTAPYHYIWNNGDTLATNYNLKAATYIITVTDVNGCSSFAPAIVSNLNGPKITTLSTVNVKCNGMKTGAITVSVSGGTAPYHYNWSNGATSSSITALFAGPYQLTVMDADSCTSVETFSIGQPLPLILTSASIKADCGVANGTASVAVSGGVAPFTYKWSNGATSNVDASVIAGVYYVAITDANGCPDSALISVSDKTGPAVSISVSANASCHSGGLVSVLASGGTLPYTYKWNNGATASSISNVPAGNYYVAVTDGKGCISSADTSVSEVIPPAISLCMVTVDPVLGKRNYIIWDKSLSKNISHYNIYKESTQAGVYFKIDSLPISKAGIYMDPLSDATVRSWRYKLSQVDSCGNESPLSQPHKTMHLTVNQGLSGYINLIWDNYEGLNFSTYYIYRDTNTQYFTLIDSIPNNLFTYTDKKPLPTSSPVYYRIGISNPGGCTPSIQSINYNAAKSNTGNVTLNTASVAAISGASASLNIFPNPSTGVFTLALSLPKESKSLNLSVINTLGQVLSTASYSNVPADFTKQMDLSSLPKGVYFIKVSSDLANLYNKVVIQ